MKSRAPRVLERIFVHSALVVATAFALYPVLWVISLGFSGVEPRATSFLPVPRGPTLSHLARVVSPPAGSEQWLFGRQLTSTLVVSSATALVAILVAAPAAYALARFEFFGKQRATQALMVTQMFPAVVTAVPLYLILHALHLLNSRTGLTVAYASTAVPFAIFQLRGALQTIPVELEEAAMVDGATRFQAFRWVVLPALRPALAVTGLFAFMSAYNEYVLAATLLGEESSYTLPVVLQRYIGEYSADWPAFAAGSVLVAAPIMALFYVLQRHLVEGLTAGSVKG